MKLGFPVVLKRENVEDGCGLAGPRESGRSQVGGVVRHRQRRQTADISKIIDSNINMEHTCFPGNLTVMKETRLSPLNTVEIP